MVEEPGRMALFVLPFSRLPILIKALSRNKHYNNANSFVLNLSSGLLQATRNDAAHVSVIANPQGEAIQPVIIVTFIS
jgi:hypothetical protein